MIELFQENIVTVKTLREMLEGAGVGTTTGEITSTGSGESSVMPTILGGTLQSAAYRSNDEGARIEMTPEEDKTLGFVAYNNNNSVVFKIVIDGADQGDIILGDYAGGQGIFWDQSAGTLDIQGGVTVDELHIPDEDTTANSFHTDTSGNSWWGCTQSDFTANNDNALAYILSTGVAKFQSITAIGVINATGGWVGAASTALAIENAGFNVGTTGHIRGGQTAYNTGTGFFLGYESGAYKFSIGDPAGDRLTWSGSALDVVGKVKLTGMSGTAGEALTAGDAVYLKQSDGKLYKTDATSNNESIYNYVGVVIDDTAIGATANLYTEGVIDGYSFTFTESVASTADWQQTTTGGKTWSLGENVDTQSYKQTFNTGDYVSNIEKVEIYFGATTGSPATTVRVDIYEVDDDGYDTGASLGSVSITPTASSWNAFTFASPIAVKPRTHYCLKISTTNNDASNYWSIGGNNAAKNGGMFYQNGSGIQGWYLNLSLALKTYYTSKRYMSVGDNVYLADTAGAIDYAPGTYQMAVGIVLSTTEILIPYKAERLIDVRGFRPSPGSNAGENSGGSGAVCVPRNARKVICSYNINEGTKGDSLILVNPLKTSADDGNVSFAWSGNYITFSFSATNNKISDLSFTFLT